MEHKDILKNWEKALKDGIRQSFVESLYKKNNTQNNKKELASDLYSNILSEIDKVVLKKFVNTTGNSVRDLPFSSLFSIVERIISYITKNSVFLLEVMEPKYRGDFFCSHSLNVTALSCTIGLEMGMDYEKLTQLGVAAILHDIGMKLIDDSVYMHSRTLDKYEKEIVATHSKKGYEHFSTIKNEFPWLLKVIEEEHLRNKEEKELNIYSQIVGICDVYEALTHTREYRKAFHPVDAIKIILQKRNLSFSSKLVKRMIETLSLYPLGSYVVLNNDKIVKVVETDKKNSLKPKVAILSDKEKTVYKLSEEKTLYITGVAYNDNYKEVEKSDNFDKL